MFKDQAIKGQGEAPWELAPCSKPPAALGRRSELRAHQLSSPWVMGLFPDPCTEQVRPMGRGMGKSQASSFPCIRSLYIFASSLSPSVLPPPCTPSPSPQSFQTNFLPPTLKFLLCAIKTCHVECLFMLWLSQGGVLMAPKAAALKASLVKRGGALSYDISC